MREYTIAATMKHDKGDGEKTYGAEIQVEGPNNLDEFVKAMGESGVVEALAETFRQEQVSTLRGRLAKKLGKDNAGGGRLANATVVDLD